jgi:Tfp pilus assembly protein FimT
MWQDFRWLITGLALAMILIVGLPGLADQLSRQRDARLAEQIAAQLQSPRTWSFTFAGVVYLCSQDPGSGPVAPSYRCVAQP